MIYNFSQKDIPKIEEVGGKARALMETLHAGFSVPEGIVLSVEFFRPWLDLIRSKEEWKTLLSDLSEENSSRVKSMAENMKLTDNQKSLLEKFMEEIPGEIFAVRSSSPEEDLENTSFAGMYESYLGVRRNDLEKFIAKAFSSCFGYRVLKYKAQYGMDPQDTSIGIIIQRQISSDISGVGFSLNPTNNAFDEVFINASFGLGEAIVSGLVTPDSYIVDTVKEKIIDKKIGNKEIGLWLNPDGGTIEKTNDNPSIQALEDKKIMELAALIKNCEEYFKRPMDIEWAYENEKLYLLQSRPITTYFPFFEELLTDPLENKRFYIDIMILTQGFQEPMSVLGLELWANMLTDVKMNLMTPDIDGTTPIIYGKEYLSLTAFEKVIGRRQTKAFFGVFDSNLKKIFSSIDLKSNPFQGQVKGTENLKKNMLKGAFKMMPSVLSGLKGNYNLGIKNYLKKIDEILEKVDRLIEKGDFKVIATDALGLMTEVMDTAPVIFSGMLAKHRMSKIFKGEDVERELSAMNMDLDGNPTSEMGLLLYEMASSKDFIEISSRDDFVEKTTSRDFSEEFLEKYDEFMEKYSARGFKEIDVASKRIYEDLGILYDKLMEINIEENQVLNVKEKRKIAYEKLLDVARKKGKEKKFIKNAEILKATFGYREHPKYIVVLIIAKIHDLCLEIGEDWVKEGRLDKAYDIFDLKSAEIIKGQEDKEFDLRSARKKNLSGYLDIKEWPLVIDSRGKIYKPELELKDGDYIGDAIAPGKVRGRAKILHYPYEKPLNPGEILVTRSTEPSWTPIFTNAAGVIMEIGGPLQHGGIIAREYGIPCVSGLMGIMDILKDGDLLEVDGSNGLVRIIKEDK